MPAGATYNSIQKITLSGSYSSLSFFNIPQTYTDLIIVNQFYNGKNCQMRFNSDSGNNYGGVFLYGAGGVAGGGNFVNSNTTYINGLYVDMTASFYNVSVTNISNYANTNVFKNVLTQQGNANQECTTSYFMWRSTAAISTITLTAGAGNFETGSTINLYGVTAA